MSTKVTELFLDLGQKSQDLIHFLTVNGTNAEFVLICVTELVSYLRVVFGLSWAGWADRADNVKFVSQLSC